MSAIASNLESATPVGPHSTAADVQSPVTVLQQAIANACNQIAPLWPLKNFVAVNPFLGFSSQTFEATCATTRRVAGADMLMPRSFYRGALANGVMTQADLSMALAQAPKIPSAPGNLAALNDALIRDPLTRHQPRAVVATVAEVLDTLAEGDRHASRTAFMIDEISKWCAAYFDEGQALWKLPSRNLPPYPAWRNAMRHDCNPEVMGIRGFRNAVARMPEDPHSAIAAVIDALGIPQRAIEEYLYRALFDIAGWAGYVRYLSWDNALYGREDNRLLHLLAIRLVWGYALFCERHDPTFKLAWASAIAAAAALPQDERLGDDPELTVDLTLQLAYEIAYQRRLLPRLATHFVAEKPSAGKCALVQAAFCIDVRSEIFRRALESQSEQIQTIGFAGFFGFPIEYVPIGQERGGAQCPVLLKPAFIVCESVTHATAQEQAQVLGLRLMRRRVRKAWKAFKLSAVSSFTYVETAGLLFGAKLLGDSTGHMRPVPDPHLDGFDSDVLQRVGPQLDASSSHGRDTGFTPEQRIAMAEAVLRAMSSTRDFARLVLLAGHGSTSVNNPHATGLDCGACGGHTGEANARVAAAILNDPEVRVGLAARGIEIPPDTWFVGALHDTTTDEVRLFESADVPARFQSDLDQLRTWLTCAASGARTERAALLNVDQNKDPDAQVIARSRDWSQVRPEWGLAGNAAFIAAPRARTRGLDLGGEAFLHSYDWRQDNGFGVLELIMTAPIVVASWINLQYYASTVNNRAFGAGNKVLHNVVGTLGVLEGNAGDLKVGLPWQSVHDGKQFIHKPLRLNVCIEAPRDAIHAVITRHQSVRELIENRWLHLYAIDDDGCIARYAGPGHWLKGDVAP